MTTVQIDDFECPHCNHITLAELDMDNCVYTCLECGCDSRAEDDKNLCDCGNHLSTDEEKRMLLCEECR